MIARVKTDRAGYVIGVTTMTGHRLAAMEPGWFCSVRGQLDEEVLEFSASQVFAALNSAAPVHGLRRAPAGEEANAPI